jgi:hypothetical protein
VILGTTTGAFFLLHRFALFLAAAPLDLKMALNLDGGPVACQAVNVSGYQRFFCGRSEIQDRAGKVDHLTWLFGRLWTLPVVLALVPKP